MMPFMPQPEGEDEQSAQEYNQAEDRQQAEEPPPPASAPEVQPPPEVRGGVNGGPLGCCLGISMGLLVCAGIASLSITYISHFFAGRGLLALLTQILVIVLAIAGFFLLSFFGWKIGRRVFREYEPSPAQIRKMARLEQRYAPRSQRKHV
jgi:predicted lipid-binding transport protein (Tim44 family)